MVYEVHIKEDLKRVVVRFYRTDSGNEPVRKWLKSLASEDRRDIGADLQTLEFGWPVGMPLCRSLSHHKGLSEVRSRLAGGQNSKGVVLREKTRINFITWVYQEITENTGSGNF